MRQGLVEYAFLTAFLALAAAGALALFGDEIRGALGLRAAAPASSAAAAPGRPPPPGPAP
jgi:Flp pilus assembly pilin Flp